jgi:hypothetical protein
MENETKPVGKPPYEPNESDRKIVETMIAVGVPQEEVSLVINVDPKTLRKYYRKELDTAAVKANASVGQSLYTKAKAGDTAAMIWWEKTRTRHKDKSTVEHEGRVDSTVKLEPFDASKLSDKALAELMAARTNAPAGE